MVGAHYFVQYSTDPRVWAGSREKEEIQIWIWTPSPSRAGSRSWNETATSAQEQAVAGTDGPGRTRIRRDRVTGQDTTRHDDGRTDGRPDGTRTTRATIPTFFWWWAV